MLQFDDKTRFTKSFVILKDEGVIKYLINSIQLIYERGYLKWQKHYYQNQRQKHSYQQ